MPSSISSSEAAEEWERTIPQRGWVPIAACALLLAIGATAAWEFHVRSQGYAPTYLDTPNLWAERRALAVGVGPEQIVLVGASRTLFDVNLTTLQEAHGGPLPIQLATVGSNPLVILEDLAADPSYAGTTLVGVVPGLVAAGGGPPLSTPERFVKHFDTWSVAQRVELPLALLLQDQLALFNEDLTLSRVLQRAAAFEPRENVYAPELPPYMYSLDRVRQARMIDRVANDPETQHDIQQLWLPLFKGPPRPAVFTEAQWDEMMAAGWDSNLARFQKAVQAISDRGGRVVFIRYPATGGVYELEKELRPNPAFWDRLLAETGAPGVSFEDHPELQGFECPEWSHLDEGDATEFTRRLARILRAQGLL